MNYITAYGHMMQKCSKDIDAEYKFDPEASSFENMENARIKHDYKDGAAAYVPNDFDRETLKRAREKGYVSEWPYFEGLGFFNPKILNNKILTSMAKRIGIKNADSFIWKNKYLQQLANGFGLYNRLTNDSVSDFGGFFDGAGIKDYNKFLRDLKGGGAVEERRMRDYMRKKRYASPEERKLMEDLEKAIRENSDLFADNGAGAEFGDMA